MIHPVVTRAHRARDDDDGFTIVEILVAITLVVIVMTALASFFVTSDGITEYSSQRQSAIQVAESAMEKARSLADLGPLHNRDKQSSDTQWNAARSGSAYPGVAPYLAGVQEAYDPGLLTPNGQAVPLPTTGSVVTLGGLAFTQNWFLGYCLRADPGSCTAGTSLSAANNYLQVVVEVTWRSRSCTNSLCSYITAGLLNANDDPVFDQSQGATKPRITNPGDQTTETGATVNLSVQVAGGTAPMTWTPPTLPTGLVWNSSVSPPTITGTPTAVTSTPLNVVLQISDAFGYSSTAAFSWTVTAGPAITAIADRSGSTGVADSLNATVTGGTSSYTWSQTTGLPPGITIATTGSTAKISGTPTKAGTFAVVVKVVDAAGAADTETLTWTVQIGLSFGTNSCSGPTNGRYDCVWNVTAAGSGPFTWKADQSGPAVTVTPSGTSAKYETFVAKGTYTITCTVTQSDGTYRQFTETAKAGT